MVKLLARIVPPVPRLRRIFAVLIIACGVAVFPYVSGVSRVAGQFASRVSLVEVYATVTGPDGRAIEGLTASDFTVDEDGVSQKIEAFASEGFALAVAVGLDRSFSMTAPTLAAAVSSTRSFVKALSPRDQVMLVGIGSDTEVLVPLTVDHAAALSALDEVDRWGTTPLFDAVVEAIDAVQAASGRRALILLSDGVDRYSRTTGPALVDYARRHDVLVYPVSIGRSRPEIWAQVASLSGGRSFFLRDLRELTPTLQVIASELRHQYLLGYAPPVGRSGWRSIRVRVNRPQTQVRARDGYFAAER
jgi:Ca-activated chloride channel homolog